MFSKIKTAAAAVALTMVAAPAAFACYGNACTGGSQNPSQPAPMSFEIQTMFSGNTQGMAEGYGDNVESQSFVNDLFTMNSFGDLTVDPNCAAECGSQTFGINFTAQQQAGNFAQSFSSGHGNVSSGARSAIAGQFNAGGMFTSSGM